MQANWSLILNIVLLLGVLVTIGLLMNARRQQNLILPNQGKPSVGSMEKPSYDPAYNDDIIAVRKINQAGFLKEDHPVTPPLSKKTHPPKLQTEPVVKSELGRVSSSKNKASALMLFLLAKENRLFAGYELLQTVLAAGLRFGEDQLFHRHHQSNGQGPVLCSLAAASSTGVFDLQNIGAFSVRGLCLFMNVSDNSGIDKERFSIMLETARHLSEGLDAHLLDDQQKPLTAERIEQYIEALQTEECTA